MRQFLPRKLQRKESTNHPLVKRCGQGSGKRPACSVPQGCSCSPGVGSEPVGGMCFCPGPSQEGTLHYHTARATHKETIRKTAWGTAQAAVAFPLRRTAWQAAPTDGWKMSVPVAPKKSCYSELRDSRNGAKNNNDRVLSLGDANANPIMLEVGSSSDEPATCAVPEEVGNANLRGPESSPCVPKEFHPLQGFAKASQAVPTGLKDFKFSLMAQRERNEESELERGADHLQALRGLQGPGLPSRRTVMGESSLEVPAKREADVPRPVPKDKLV